MNIKEYAQDIGVSVEKILKHMERLAMPVDDLDRILSDEEVILLDNSIQDEEDYVQDEQQLELENDFELEEKAEQIAMDAKFKDETSKVTKVKSKQAKQQDAKTNFAADRKKIYKHRQKLQSNEAIIQDDVLLYKDNMTVGEVASALQVSTGELIKKLMGLSPKTAIIVKDDNAIEISIEELEKVTNYKSWVDVSKPKEN